MHKIGRAGLLAGAVLAVTLGAGCSPAPSASAPATSNAPVSFPAPKTPPAPAALLNPAPAAGEVRLEPGPFTDRVALTGLRLDAAAGVVHGHLTITSDVSDVLALDIRAAFYGADGKLLGTGTFHYQEEGDGEEHKHAPATHGGIDIAVAAAPATNGATSAVLSIPVLVNE